MQGYTLWVPCFADITGMSHDAVRARLVADTCFTCVYLNQAKGDVTRAVGLHHSHTPARATVYQAKVLRAAARLFPPSPVHAPPATVASAQTR